MRLCNCTECHLLSTNDPVSGALLKGQYVGDFEFKQHRNRDLAQIRANAQLERLEPGLPSHNQATFPSPTNPQPSHTASRYALPEDEGHTTQPSTTDIFQGRLRTIYKKIDGTNIKQLFEHTQLVFRSPPSPLSRPMVLPCADQLALADNVPANKSVIELERWMESAHDLVEVILARSDLGGEGAKCRDFAEMVLSKVQHEQGAMLVMKQAQWEKIRSDILSMSDHCKRVVTDRRVARPFLHVDPRLLLSYLLIAFLHLIAGLSLRHCRIVLVTMRGLLSLGQPDPGHGPPIHTQLPRDVETAIARLDLTPQTRAYVCCSKCFALYAYNPKESGAFPEVCSSTRTSSSVPCGALLSSHPRPGAKARSSRKPIRLYLHNELHDYVGSMYCRGDIESSLDRDLTPELSPSPDGIDDILGSPGLTNFLGPEGDPNRPFLRRPGNEGRLVFSLNMDGFNPFMNKESGKKVSVGAIYMVCLSLPPAIRYDIQNMYLVAIIPGPNEPSKDEINHLIEPLVDDLLIIWYHGFFLLSTCNHPHGRLVRAAVIALVCDLLAAKQMSGFAGISSHHFCSHCTLDLDDIDDFNYLLWPRRTAQEHRELADQWKAAPTEAERDIIFSRTGIRWSQLLRLPYWDPTKYVTIDSMHGFSLRMFQRHCRQIWGMNADIVDSDYPSFAHEKGRPSEEVMEKAMDILRYGSEEKLRALKRDVLRELARATESVPYAGRVKKLVSGLLRYRVEKGWFGQDGKAIASTLDLTGAPQILPPIGGPQRRDRPATAAEIEHGCKVVQSGTRSAVKKFRKPVLLGICQQLDIEVDPSLLVAEILEKLEDWRFQEGIVDEDGVLLVVKRGKKTVVLGKDTLEEVRMDMSNLELPSWVSRAPGRPGEAKTGKFTADQWRTFCQINLTVTLNRLWGQEDEGSRKRLMLENFMHLVTAIKLGTMRRMTRQRIDAYVFHIQQYLSNLIVLYPGTTISPYQHLALHFQEFLERFGPVHAWRCFPFERYNYLLQQIPTNMKFGEMESTLLKTFCKGQKLYSLVDLDENQVPGTLHDILAEWQSAVDNDLRGSRINDTLAMDDTFNIKDDVDVLIGDKKEALPRFWLLLLRDHLRAERGQTESSLSQFGYQKKRVRRRGETFQSRGSSACDSNIFYQSARGVQAGSIEGMFIHDCGGTENHLFVVIKPYLPIPKELECYDPYRRFSEAAGQLYRDSVGAEVLVHVKDVLYHFAKAPVKIRHIPFSCIVALPLDR